jgi:hypothetical protein
MSARLVQRGCIVSSTVKMPTPGITTPSPKSKGAPGVNVRNRSRDSARHRCRQSRRRVGLGNAARIAGDDDGSEDEFLVAGHGQREQGEFIIAGQGAGVGEQRGVSQGLGVGDRTRAADPEGGEHPGAQRQDARGDADGSCAMLQAPDLPSSFGQMLLCASFMGTGARDRGIL